MVVIDEPKKFAPPARGSAAYVVTGAGSDEANGLYVPTGKVWHDAPVFENDKKCLLSREPHRNQKTGETNFGWIIGLDRKPLFAVQSEEKSPPSSGWRKFNGTLPIPNLKGATSVPEAAALAAQSWKDQGNALFAARRYDEADAKWTRAIGLIANITDEQVKVALYSNRAEARLRQQLWDAALGDAQAALQMRPSHDKALLRAAVAARELKKYREAQDFVLTCLEHHPRSAEAKQMLEDLDDLVQSEQRDVPDKVKSARQKLQQSIKQKDMDGDDTSRAAGPKDLNSQKMFKAFEGYSDKKTAGDRAPLTTLPYHHMGLPQDQVELMDKFFQEQRDKKDTKASKEKQEKEMYEKVKKEFKARAMDNADGLAPIDEIMPNMAAQKKQQLEEEFKKKMEERARTTMPMAGGAKPASKKVQSERTRLSQKDTDEIDALFEPLGAKKIAKASEASLSASEKKKASERLEKLNKAKALVTGVAAE